MDRVEFTGKIVTLLGLMINEGELPIIDFVRRSDEEQKRLFCLGLSKCDGTNKVSRHQRGKAIDIYFVNDSGGGLREPKRGFKHWHDKWEEMGGKPMLDWDKGHFE